MNTRTAYATDLTDAQYTHIQPLLPAEQAPSGRGRKRVHAFREILNGIFYLLRTGCQWRLLPHDFPPYGTVSYYYGLWRKSGLLDEVHDALRGEIRQQAGKEPTPSLLLLDSQSVKTTEKGGHRNLRKLSALTTANSSKAANATSSPTRSACSGVLR